MPMPEARPTGLTSPEEVPEQAVRAEMPIRPKAAMVERVPLATLGWTVICRADMAVVAVERVQMARIPCKLVRVGMVEDMVAVRILRVKMVLPVLEAAVVAAARVARARLVALVAAALSLFV